MCVLLGIEHSQTSAYHPQGNGQVERFNRTIEAMLSKVVQSNQRDWDNHLPKVLLAYRTAIYESTRFTPYHLMAVPHNYQLMFTLEELVLMKALVVIPVLFVNCIKC